MSKLTTPEQIIASTSIQQEVKNQLGKAPTQDLRPAPLTKWTRETFAIGRKYGHEDLEIAEWIRAYGKKYNWSERQIYAVLHDNGVSQERYHEPEGAETAVLFKDLVPFKRLTMKLMGTTDETMIIQMDYSPEKIGRAAHKGILDGISRMDDFDLKEFPKWLKILKELLGDCLDVMEDKKKSMARSKPQR